MGSDDNAIELLQAIAVCCEFTQTKLSEAAVRAMAEDLGRYPHAQVIGALSRCRRELKGRMAFVDIVERLADSRPGPQEAWAIVAPCFRNEAPTIVWTDEMSLAWGVARMCEGAISARMAYLESYRALCQQARYEGRPAKWTICLGHDKAGRDGPLLAAVAAGLLPSEHVEQYLIGDSARDELLRITGQQAKELSGPRPPPPEFKALSDKLTGGR